MNQSATYQISVGPALTAKIPPGSPYWNKFNGAFENMELKHNEFVTAVYNGRPFTTWHKDWRATKNYLLGRHLGIDFDTEDKRSSVSHLASDPFIQKYASLIYTTPSHAIDKPRARVVFLLDEPIRQVKNYALAASSLLWLYGEADRMCKDPARFFYGAGGGCDMELLTGILPLDVIKDTIRQYQKTGQRQKKTTTYEAKDTDEQDVQDALKHINPWGIEYNDWVSILMSIHSEFPGGNGLSMAEAWGQGYDGEVERKWKSFDSSGNTLGKVGIGTLFHRAIENGYKKERV